jgi:hypothetical protein
MGKPVRDQRGFVGTAFHQPRPRHVANGGPATRTEDLGPRALTGRVSLAYNQTNEGCGLGGLPRDTAGCIRRQRHPRDPRTVGS